MPEHLLDFVTLRHDLTTIDGVIMYKDRIGIPTCTRDEVLSALSTSGGHINYFKGQG